MYDTVDRLLKMPNFEINVDRIGNIQKYCKTSSCHDTSYVRLIYFMLVQFMILNLERVGYYLMFIAI